MGASGPFRQALTPPSEFSAHRAFRHVEAIALPAGKTVSLAPGGLHVMLFDLKHPLAPGDTVPLELAVKTANGKARVVRVTAEVRNLDGSAPAAHEHHR